MSNSLRGPIAVLLRLLQQHLNAQPVIHRFTRPASGGGAFIYMYAQIVVVGGYLRPVGERLGVSGSDAVERLAVGLREADRAVVENMNLHGALVHFAVMKAA